MRFLPVPSFLSLFPLPARTQTVVREVPCHFDRPTRYMALGDSLAAALLDRGDIAAALDLWRRAIELQPDEVRLLQHLAWVLATCRDEHFRSGDEALSVARKALRLTGGEPITARLTRAPGNDAEIGGLKVMTQNGWFAARPSGTEDVYKIYAESFLGEEHLQRIQEEAVAIVSAALAKAGV